MKIHIRGNEKDLNLWFPTGMVCNATMVRLWLRTAKKYSDTVPDIPPHSVNALCRELKRIKKTYGEWTLVDVESADGQEVKIIL